MPEGGDCMSDNQRTPVASVGIIHRERSDEATALARALEERIRATGRQVWSAERDEDSAISDRLPGTSVALVLGGDGTILSVARLVAPLNIPILGINFGRVGFLTELEPAEVEEKLPLYLAGDYWVDERSMLQAEVGEMDGTTALSRSMTSSWCVARSRASFALKCGLTAISTTRPSPTASSCLRQPARQRIIWRPVGRFFTRRSVAA